MPPDRTMGGVFIYHNLKGEVPYLLPAIGLAFFISRKGGLTLAEDKKNIGRETEKPGEAPQDKKAAPIKDTSPVPEHLDSKPVLTVKLRSLWKRNRSFRGITQPPA